MDAVDEDGNAENLVVDVTAKLYWWEFEYPRPWNCYCTGT